MQRSRETRERHIGLLLSLTLVFLITGCSAAAQVGTKLGDGFRAQQAYAEGLERYQAKNYTDAISHFERALSLQPDFDDAEGLLAWSYYRTGKYPEATRHFRQAITRQPKWEGLYDGLGWSRFQVGRYHLALEAFRQALALDRSYRDAGVGYAYTLFELGRYAEALPHLERLTHEGEANALRSAALDEENVRSRYAWTLFYLGDYAKAREQFTRGIAARPEWSGLYNGLGWTFLRLGDRVQARLAFQRAIELKPDLGDAKDGLAQLRP